MKNSSGNISNNPLYPPKKESDAKGILLAVASVIVAIICLVFIVSHFSYAMHPEKMGTGWGRGNTVQTSENDQGLENTVETSGNDQGLENTVQTSGNDVQSEDLGESVLQDDSSDEPDIIEENGDYILPNSSTMYLSRSDIEHLNQEQLRIARNEIFARHGRSFTDEVLQQYFDSKDWYSSTVGPDEFDADVLNDCERANVTLIQSYEEEMGYR